jgi:DNA replication protein
MELKMFELKPINELVQIAAAGGGFRIKVNVKSTTDLVQIAAAASKTGAHIIFIGLKTRPQDELVQIAAAGKGCVFFDEAVLT